MRGRVQSHYAVSKCSDGWVISADGAMVLICARRKTALRTIRDAIASELSLVAMADAIIADEHGFRPPDSHDRDAACASPPARSKRSALNSSS